MTTEGSNRTALVVQYGVRTQNDLWIPVNLSEKIRAPYVTIASIEEHPRPRLECHESSFNASLFFLEQKINKVLPEVQNRSERPRAIDTVCYLYIQKSRSTWA